MSGARGPYFASQRVLTRDQLLAERARLLSEPPCDERSVALRRLRSRLGGLERRSPGMSVEDAAEYLSISATTLRELEIGSRRIGKRVLYDIRELDRFVDRMADQASVAPTGAGEGMDAARAAEEQAFFERRRRRGAN